VTRQDEEDDEARLNGIRGWLLVFVVLAAASSAGGVALSWLLITAGEGWLPRVQGAVTLALSAYGGYCAWLLGNARREAPAHARLWLIGLAANGLAVGVLGLALQGEPPSGFLRPVLFAMIWLPYLARSKRVAIVYGSREPVRPPDPPPLEP
jgi:hypothetical protein